MSELPGNSHRSRQEQPPAKKIERVVVGEVVTRNQPMLKRFGRTFFAARADTVAEYVFWDVILPGAKNVIADMGSAFIDRLMFGDGAAPRGRASGFGIGGPSVGSYGNQHTNYNRPGGAPVRPDLSWKARSTHDFKEISIQTRAEADQVLDEMYKQTVEYNAVTVADFYELCGITPNYTDDKYGWSDISEARVLRSRGGYVIDLPRPEPLN